MADIHDLTALEQAAAIRRGELSPAPSWSRTTSTRIAAHDGALGAFVTVTADAARAEAAALARPRRLGRCAACRPPSRT